MFTNNVDLLGKGEVFVSSLMWDVAHCADSPFLCPFSPVNCTLCFLLWWFQLMQKRLARPLQQNGQKCSARSLHLNRQRHAEPAHLNMILDLVSASVFWIPGILWQSFWWLLNFSNTYNKHKHKIIKKKKIFAVFFSPFLKSFPRIFQLFHSFWIQLIFVNIVNIFHF